MSEAAGLSTGGPPVRCAFRRLSCSPKRNRKISWLGLRCFPTHIASSAQTKTKSSYLLGEVHLLHLHLALVSLPLLLALPFLQVHLLWPLLRAPRSQLLAKVTYAGRCSRRRRKLEPCPAARPRCSQPTTRRPPRRKLAPGVQEKLQSKSHDGTAILSGNPLCRPLWPGLSSNWAPEPLLSGRSRRQSSPPGMAPVSVEVLLAEALNHWRPGHRPPELQSEVGCVGGI